MDPARTEARFRLSDGREADVRLVGVILSSVAAVTLRSQDGVEHVDGGLPPIPDCSATSSTTLANAPIPSLCITSMMTRYS